MNDERTVRIDAVIAEIESVGQFDRTEKWRGKLEISRDKDGRLRISHPTQAGFAALVVSWDDLAAAVERLGP